MLSKSCHSCKCGFVRPERLRSVITGENTEIILDTRQHSGELHDGAFTHFDMKVAQLENCKTVKYLWDTRRCYIVSPQFDLCGVPLPSSIKTRKLEA